MPIERVTVFVSELIQMANKMGEKSIESDCVPESYLFIITIELKQEFHL